MADLINHTAHTGVIFFLYLRLELMEPKGSKRILLILWEANSAFHPFNTQLAQRISSSQSHVLQVTCAENLVRLPYDLLNILAAGPSNLFSCPQL
jgi:hypothetical protein